MKKHLFFKIFILLSVFIVSTIEGVKAQTLDFTFSKDTLSIDDSLIITNTSSGFEQNGKFLWEFSTCNFLLNDSTVVCSDTTSGTLEFVIGKFYHTGTCLITLKALDSLGNIITSIQYFSKMLYIVKLKLKSCAIVLSCNDPEPLNPCENICNGTFKRYSQCPQSQDQLCFADPWQISFDGNFQSSTPDYYNSCFGLCSGTQPYFGCFGVPTNEFTNNLASHTLPGPNEYEGYAGFWAFYNDNGFIHREYLQQPLRVPLIQGVPYTISMYISHSGRCDLACNNIQMYFSDVQPIQPWEIAIPGIINAQLTTLSGIINSNNSWMHYTATYTPTVQDLAWVTIGVFDTYSITNNNYDPFYNTNNIMLDGAYYFIDDVSITSAVATVNASADDQNICIGHCTDLHASGATSYTWMPGNLTGATVQVCPTSTTTYTVTGTSPYGCTGTATVTVAATSGISQPIIVGNHNNCDEISTYTISNPQSNCTYTWTLDNSLDYTSNTFPDYSNSITIHWDEPFYTLGGQIAEFTWLYVTVTDINGCIATDTIKIWKCCAKGTLNDQVNDITVYTPDIFNNGQIINGTITVNYDLTASNGMNILMGPEAKIIVNPPYTFTLNSKTIRSECHYMWDGIYIVDSNAHLVIQGLSYVQDAINGIVSENGGKFVLDNSRFFNNHISVQAKNNYWGPYVWPHPGFSHKGEIKKCIFDIAGAGLIRPYLGQKPLYGVYANNADRLQIGDSITASNTNTFRNMVCGVYSKNSGVTLVNNIFELIRSNYPCLNTMPPQPLTTLTCETAVFSISYIPNPSSNNHPPGGPSIHASSLKCGGVSSTTPNYFNACSNGIYTYKTRTRITNNTFTDTDDGIECRDHKPQSYISLNTFNTQMRYGIKVINTVPSYCKINVMNNTFYDPKCGIYMKYVRSQGTNVNFRSAVWGNKIYHNNTGVCTGISFRSCERIEAYCNSVLRNNALMTSGSVRGIIVESCENAWIHDNTCYNNGSGIYGAGALLGTQFTCNHLDLNYDGFYFNGPPTAISDQGDDAHPTDNQWANQTGGNDYSIDGPNYTSPCQKFWYCRFTNPPYFPAVLPGLDQFIYPQPANHPIAENCLSCTPNMSAKSSIDSAFNDLQNSINNNAMPAIIGDSNNYGKLNPSFKYFERQYAYDVLGNEDISRNQQFSDFYAELKNGNIGSFDSVYQLIEREAYDTAYNLNKSIEPLNKIEQNRQAVNQAYMEYVVPQKEIPHDLLNTLVEIAIASPFVEGDAVYTARAILRMEPTLISGANIPDSMTIAGYVHDNPNCHVQMAVGDTLIIKSPEGMIYDNITPAITDADGHFSFDTEELQTIDDTVVFTIATKSNFSANELGAYTYTNWKNQSPLYVNLVNIHKVWDYKSDLPELIFHSQHSFVLSDHIYIAGSYYNNADSTIDVALQKIDSAGNVIWELTYSEGGNENVADITVDDSLKYLFVLINTDSVNSVFSQIVVFDSTGSLEWKTTLPFKYGKTILHDNSGFVNIIGDKKDVHNPGIIRYSIDGAYQWVKEITDCSVAALDNDNNTIIITIDSAYNSSHVKVFNKEEGYQTSDIVIYDIYINNLIVDEDNHYLMSGNSCNGGKIFTMKYIIDTGIVWNNSISSDSISIATGCMTRDTSGNISVLYYNDYGFGITSFNTDGYEIWTTNESGDWYASIQKMGLKSDEDGCMYNLVACEYLPSEIFRSYLFKYNNMGEKQWEQLIDYTNLFDFAISENFNIYLNGNAYCNTNYYSQTTQKYAQCFNTSNLRSKEDNKTIVEKETETFIKLYPNPNDGSMQLEYNFADHVKGVYEMYDYTGRKVYSKELKSSSGKADISAINLSKGIYMYRVISEGISIAKGKVVIIK